MHVSEYFSAFNTQAAVLKSRLQPAVFAYQYAPKACTNCSFINHADYNFCTNCGYPVTSNNEHLSVFERRLNRRLAIKRSFGVKILQARNALYVLSALFIIIFIVTFSAEVHYFNIKGFVMLLVGVLYALLAGWSLYKPFTALLVGLMVQLSFTTINAWTQWSDESSNMLYYFFIQSIFIYFLWRGVKAAFQADTMEEELNQ